ncbi:hypothetical protein BDB00DRAFT_870301 [Zychaea mexicana]|uniref:uncharacterized protein n=1 Tax=Zychaea mexicana TaxID=64656 RepID=UPI0022FEB910|nr:uncharacterized protein BDB00DRAFT_870301 [Zychaea mexicana]KAI9495441.1 hypothetical protein BDB00DRAFT_870301 [Zychaea mexicana]
MVVHVGSRLVRSSKRFVIQLLLDYHLPPEPPQESLVLVRRRCLLLKASLIMPVWSRIQKVGLTWIDSSSSSDSHEDQHDKYALGFFESHSREIGSDRLDIRRNKSTGFCRQGTSIKPKTGFSTPPSEKDSLEHPGFASKKPGSSQKRDSPLLQVEKIPLNTQVSPPRNQDQAKDGILHSSKWKRFP